MLLVERTCNDIVLLFVTYLLFISYPAKSHSEGSYRWNAYAIFLMTDFVFILYIPCIYPFFYNANQHAKRDFNRDSIYTTWRLNHILFFQIRLQLPISYLYTTDVSFCNSFTWKMIIVDYYQHGECVLTKFYFRTSKLIGKYRPYNPVTVLTSFKTVLLTHNSYSPTPILQ